MPLGFESERPSVRSRPDSSAPGNFGPLELVVLQGTSLCNLDCSYCYLTRESRRKFSAMRLEDLRTLFLKIFSSEYLNKKLHVSWHSGEPLTLKTGYYGEAIASILDLARSRGPAGLDVQFDIQTNGTLLDRKWCDFLLAHSHCLSLGISCDGPAFLHDRHRRNWSGHGSHARVTRGMDLLAASGLEFDVISVLSTESLDYPEEFLAFFAPYSDHIRSFHFNLLDEVGIGSEDGEALNAYADRYAHFLRRLLAASGRATAAGIPPRIRNFSAFYERVFGSPEMAARHTARNMCTPFRTLNIQANGDVSSFYAGLTGEECADQYGDGRGFLVGNLLEQSLDAIAHSPKLRRIRRDFEASHLACEKECPFHSLCSGGYNLVKLKRYGRFDVAQTPECIVNVQTFVRTMLEEIQAGIAAETTSRQPPVQVVGEA